MSENTFDKEQELDETADNITDNNSEDIVDEGAELNEQAEEVELSTEEKLNNELQESKDKYLRLVAEFDNYKKRTSKERIELVQTAGREIIQDLLNVLDDCERATKQLEAATDISDVKEGVSLVFNKLQGTLQHKGLKKMDVINQAFNPDLHEAITDIPAPTEDMKGKIIDVVESGYYLNDKIIRHAKVVVGK